MSAIHLNIGAAPGPVPENTSTLVLKGKDTHFSMPMSEGVPSEEIRFDHRKNKTRFYAQYHTGK